MNRLISKIDKRLTLDYLKYHAEDSFFDRKSVKIHLKDLANTICSFANANGGVIAVGIEDDGTINGFSFLEQDKYNQFQKILSNTYFKILPICTIEEVKLKNDKNLDDLILLFHVYASTNKIIYNAKGEVYLRQGDSSNKITDKEQIKLLEYERNESVFEDELVRRATLEDLDEEVLDLYRKKIHTNLETRDLLKARKFLIKDRDNEYLTNAAVLLFAKDPSLFLPSARVRVIKVDGTVLLTGTGMNIIKDVTFALPLYKVILETEKFIATQLREFSHLGEDGKFVSIPEYPEFAWKEGLVNAVTHRDYSISGEHIKIMLYDDRMEIISPGKLPGLITLESMMTERFSRNPKISRVLYDLNIVRELNEGVKRIYKEMKDYFLDDPEYSEPQKRSVKLVLKNNVIMRNKRKNETLLKNTDLNKSWDNLNLLEQQMIQAIHDRGKMTTSELAELINRDRKTVQRKLKKLQDLGLVTWIGTSIKDPQKVYILK